MNVMVLNHLVEMEVKESANMMIVILIQIIFTFVNIIRSWGGIASETTVFFMLLIKIVCLCRIDLINVLRDFVHIFIPNINFAFQSMTNAN